MRELTILFMPESAYGPTSNCIGIGDLLRRRGHRVVFAAEASWQGKLAPLGFTEDLVDLAAPAGGAGAVDPGQFWKDFVRDTAPEFRKPTIEQLESWIEPVWEELTSGARYCQRQLVDIIERVRPDVIVEDNVVEFPALPDLEFISEGDLNLYVCPEVADYRRTRPLGAGWLRLDSSASR